MAELADYAVTYPNGKTNVKQLSAPHAERLRMAGLEVQENDSRPAKKRGKAEDKQARTPSNKGQSESTDAE